ncbi:MAG: crosslink repair DNA glycosylase YcaQ family protein [Thermoplasmata archaeon]
MDPLNVVGRNQDLVLASRVVGYRPEYLDALLYKERAAFEFGGTVSIFPRDELGLQWSWVQNEGLPMRWIRWHDAHAATVRHVRREIQRVGPADSRRWNAGERTDDYRGSTVEGMALYYLWRNLEILIHHREGNRKFYDLTERLFGPLPPPMSKEETIDQMALETISRLGLTGPSGIAYIRTNEAGRGRSLISKRQIRQRLIDDGRLAEVRIEGEREPSVLRRDQLLLLEEVEAGGVPRQWKPLTQEPEALFLAPLDTIVRRELTQSLFDFEYLLEFYKPAIQRRWGYYVLPVLVGDRLVGRIEPVRNDTTNSLRVHRAWWEKGVRAHDVAAPVARGLVRMSERLGMESVQLGHVGGSTFRDAIKQELRRHAG